MSLVIGFRSADLFIQQSELSGIIQSSNADTKLQHYYLPSEPCCGLAYRIISFFSLKRWKQVCGAQPMVQIMINFWRWLHWWIEFVKVQQQLSRDLTIWDCAPREKGMLCAVRVSLPVLGTLMRDPSACLWNSTSGKHNENGCNMLSLKRKKLTWNQLPLGGQ